MRKKLISLLLAATMLAALCVPASAAGTAFTDVSGWAAPYIERAHELGLVNGTGGGRYSPSNPVTYAEFATMLVNINWKDELADAKEHGYDSSWWEPYCYVAQKHHLFDNTEMTDYLAWDTTAGNPVTRSEMAMVMYNYLKDASKSGPSAAEVATAKASIKDIAHLGEEHKDAVAYCFAGKTLSGTGGGKFDPDSSMNRAQAATVLCNVYDAVQGTSYEADEGDTSKPSSSDLEIELSYRQTSSGGKTISIIVTANVKTNRTSPLALTISPAEDYPGLIMTEDDMVMLQGAGTVEFGTIGFTEAGTYKFIIEQAGGIENYRYDDRTWELTVTVASDGGAPAGAIGGHYDVSKYDVPVDKNKDGWITQSEFDARIEELKVQYPAGTLWNDASVWGTDATSADGYINSSGLHYYRSSTIGAGTGCAAWAKLLSDRIFGNLPWREFTDVYSMRPGDIIWDKLVPHWMVYTKPEPTNANYMRATCSPTSL